MLSLRPMRPQIVWILHSIFPAYMNGCRSLGSHLYVDVDQQTRDMLLALRAGHQVGSLGGKGRWKEDRGSGWRGYSQGGVAIDATALGSRMGCRKRRGSCRWKGLVMVLA